MGFYGVGLRCAVQLSLLGLDMDPEIIKSCLVQKGFQFLDVDVVAVARECVGASRYRRGCDFRLAPQVVDCSSFVKWLYAQKGIWLPRYAVEQFDYVSESISLECVARGDLLFTEGCFGFDSRDFEKVGHVGMVTHAGTLIHASRGGVYEVSVADFLKTGCFAGVRRVIMTDDVLTVVCPSNLLVERSETFRYIVLQSRWV